MGLHGRSVKKCRFVSQKSSEFGSGGYPTARRATLFTQTSCFIVVQSYDEILSYDGMPSSDEYP